MTKEQKLDKIKELISAIQSFIPHFKYEILMNKTLDSQIEYLQSVLNDLWSYRDENERKKWIISAVSVLVGSFIGIILGKLF